MRPSRANAVVATALGSIPASSDTVESKGRQMTQCWISYIKSKNPKKSPIKKYYYLLGDGVVREGGLVRVPLLAELHVAEEERGGDHLEDRVQLLVRHTHHLSAKYIREAVQSRVGNKKPTQKTPKKPPKKPTINGFLFFIFNENNTNYSLWNRFFMNK